MITQLELLFTWFHMNDTQKKIDKGRMYDLASKIGNVIFSNGCRIQ